MHKIPIMISVFIAGLLLLSSACTPALAPAQPTHEELNFQLSTNTTPGNTDAYDSYSFSIYLKREQELALDFYAEGAAVMVSIFTPSEETWGYNPNPPTTITTEDEKSGCLKQGRIMAAEEGNFTFTTPETGDYLLTVKSASPKGEIEVRVEYQIQ